MYYIRYSWAPNCSIDETAGYTYMYTKVCVSYTYMYTKVVAGTGLAPMWWAYEALFFYKTRTRSGVYTKALCSLLVNRAQ